MRILCLICLMLGARQALRAQTNPPPAAINTNAPTEVQPTDILSKSCQFFLKSNLFIYRGDVHIDNPQMKLTCELLTIEAPKLTNANRFNRATAETNVVIDWVDSNGPNHATSDKAVYTYQVTNLSDSEAQPHLETNATVVLTGNPVVTNHMYRWEGDPLIWDRINDSISSTNMKRHIIYQQQTNTSDLFVPPSSNTEKPNKTAK